MPDSTQLSTPANASAIADARPSPVPRTFWAYIVSFGPGVVVALTWVGTGDLIGNSVAGGNYGYALLWALALSLLVRFAFVSGIARYPIYNIRGDTSLVRGFTRLHPAFAAVMLVSFVAYAHILGAYMLSGAGDALHALTGYSLDKFTWAAIASLSVLIFCLRGGFRLLEKIFTGILLVMMISFFVAVVRLGINWPDFIQGLVYTTPPAEGAFDSSLIVAGLFLATTGSILNFVYPEFLREKGWITPGHRRVQQYDLLFATLIVLVLGVTIWIIGAEALYGHGAVEDVGGIAAGLAAAIGPSGTYIFYFGLLAAAWTSITAATFALSRMAVQCMHLLRPARARRYREDAGKDPMRRWVIFFACSAVAWSLPFAPDFVVLTIALSALSAPFLILMVGGLIPLLNRKDLMGEHTNRWWHNATLLIVLVLVGIAGYQGIQEAIKILFGG